MVVVGWWLAGCWLFVAAGGWAQPIENVIRPNRPKSFASPDDLRSYLDQLGQYYAIAGRPRFGKRANLIEQPSEENYLNRYGQLPQITDDSLYGLYYQLPNY